MLNTAVDNFFAEVEQVAFAPGNLVPGIEPSTDRILQVSRQTQHDVIVPGTQYCNAPEALCPRLHKPDLLPWASAGGLAARVAYPL